MSLAEPQRTAEKRESWLRQDLQDYQDHSVLKHKENVLFILVRQAKPGQSCELKGVHLVSCPFGK
jgi:hypothetical protein